MQIIGRIQQQLNRAGAEEDRLDNLIANLFRTPGGGHKMGQEKANFKQGALEQGNKERKVPRGLWL